MKNVYYLKKKQSATMIVANTGEPDEINFVIARHDGITDMIISYVKMDSLRASAIKEMYISVSLKCIMKSVLLHQQYLKWGNSIHNCLKLLKMAITFHKVQIISMENDMVIQL